MQSIPFPLTGLLKPSHRTRAEQGVGLSIFLLLSAAGLFLNPIFSWFWTLYHLLLPFSMWTLWRRYSLRRLKLELSVYLALALFQMSWTLSLFYLQETLLALVALLLLWCTQLLATLLFWKKERLSGLLLILPFLWVFYIMALNMVTCLQC